MPKNLRLPEDLDPTLPNLEMFGDTCLLLSNHTGVRAYDANRMVIGCKKYDVIVQGADLELSELSIKTLTVRGQILQVGFARTQGGIDS